MTTPSRDEYTQWGTSHFDALANSLRNQIAQSAGWANSHLDMIRNPGGTEWTGKGADAAADLAEQAVNVTKGRINAAQDLISIAERGRDSVQGAMSKLNDAISTAEQEGFEVTSNWSVIPTGTWDSSTLNTAAEHANNIGYHLKSLVDTDSAIHGELTKKAAELDGLKLPRPKGKGDVQLVSNEFKQDVPGDGQPKPDPKILGVTPTADPQGPEGLPPGQTSLTDLNDTTPGWAHTITGDPHGPPDHPMLDGQLLPIKAPDGTRLLPTGVGRDPNGNVVVAFSNPPYAKSTDPSAFTTKDTQLWNFTDPQHPVKIGDLPNMSQASVFYNSAEKQWVVVGNDMTANGTPRTVWTAPDTPGSNQWMHNLGHGTAIPGGGNRENQYYPLKGGGVMLIDAADNTGVHAYVAPNTQGLTAPDVATRDIATPNTFHPTIPPDIPPQAPKGSTWQPNPVPYGATVTNDVINPDGTESVTVRVSTWDQLVPPAGASLPGDMAGDKNYFPHTYTYTVTVGH